MFLSALLVDVASWRWLFVLPIVLVVVALAMTMRSVPSPREHAGHSFDTIGALTSVIAVAGLIFTLQEGPEHGWSAPTTLIALTVGIIATITFVAWELRRRDAAPPPAVTGTGKDLARTRSGRPAHDARRRHARHPRQPRRRYLTESVPSAAWRPTAEVAGAPASERASLRSSLRGADSRHGQAE